MPGPKNSVVVIVPGARDPLRAQYLALFPRPEEPDPLDLSFPSLSSTDRSSEFERVIEVWKRDVQPTITIENIVAHKGWFTLLLNDLCLHHDERNNALDYWDKLYGEVCGQDHLDKISGFRQALIKSMAKGVDRTVRRRFLPRLSVATSFILFSISLIVLAWYISQRAPA